DGEGGARVGVGAQEGVLDDAGVGLRVVLLAVLVAVLVLALVVPGPAVGLGLAEPRIPAGAADERDDKTDSEDLKRAQPDAVDHGGSFKCEGSKGEGREREATARGRRIDAPAIAPGEGNLSREIPERRGYSRQSAPSTSPTTQQPRTCGPGPRQCSSACS